MLSQEKIKQLISNAQIESDKTRKLFGKEVYQKRFKPVYEGYITALCTVLETSDDNLTEQVRKSKE